MPQKILGMTTLLSMKTIFGRILETGGVDNQSYNTIESIHMYSDITKHMRPQVIIHHLLMSVMLLL